jgi:hypothetical protein
LREEDPIFDNIQKQCYSRVDQEQATYKTETPEKYGSLKKGLEAKKEQGD